MTRAIRVPISPLLEGERPLDDDAAIYATRVLRLGVGARFLAFDPAVALEADAQLVALGGRGATVARFSAARASAAIPSRQVTLIQGVGKGDKMDAIVRDATELGATRIVPAIAERSVRRPEAKQEARWRRIAIEAARQCGRGDAPRIDPISSLDDAVTASRVAPPGLAVALHPGEGAEPLGARFARLSVGAVVVLLVGPEGGIAPAELERCVAAGFVTATLGAFVLRTETACAAALGALACLAP